MSLVYLTGAKYAFPCVKEGLVDDGCHIIEDDGTDLGLDLCDVVILVLGDSPSGMEDVVGFFKLGSAKPTADLYVIDTGMPGSRSYDRLTSNLPVALICSADPYQQLRGMMQRAKPNRDQLVSNHVQPADEVHLEGAKSSSSRQPCLGARLVQGCRKIMPLRCLARLSALVVLASAAVGAMALARVHRSRMATM